MYRAFVFLVLLSVLLTGCTEETPTPVPPTPTPTRTPVPTHVPAGTAISPLWVAYVDAWQPDTEHCNQNPSLRKGTQYTFMRFQIPYGQYRATLRFCVRHATNESPIFVEAHVLKQLVSCHTTWNDLPPDFNDDYLGGGLYEPWYAGGCRVYPTGEYSFLLEGAMEYWQQIGNYGLILLARDCEGDVSVGYRLDGFELILE